MFHSLPHITGHLTLGYNKRIGSLSREIKHLTSLTHLALGENQLNGSLPGKHGLSTLNTLDLELDLDLIGNQFTGSIPQGFGMLIQFDVCIFMNGSLSVERGRLTSLTDLGLRNSSSWHSSFRNSEI
jgi:Leucine-rich repeat (LRR) protein